MPPETEALELSIIVPAFRSAATIRMCLEALCPQLDAARHELIVIDSGDDTAASIIEASYRQVRLIRAGNRLHPGGARNLGIRQARGRMLCFIDSDCRASPDFVHCALAAQARSPGLIGGTVGNGNPSEIAGWVPYLVEFHRWMPGSPSGPRRDLPTCCMTMPRAMFDRFGPFRETGYCSDTAFCWRAGRAGVVPRVDPALRVAHVNDSSLLRSSCKQFRHGRDFARMRVVEQGFPRARTALHALTSPLLPLVLSGRLFATIFTRVRRHRMRTLAMSPLLLLALILWSAGEAVGYVAHLVEGRGERSSQGSATWRPADGPNGR